MTTTEQEPEETKALLESRVAALTTARAAAEIALANERAERLQLEADRELAHKLWQEDEARLERAVAAREKAEAEVTRLRGSLGVAEIRLGEGVALLERWNKLSMPTCEELQSETCDFLSRIRAEATAEPDAPRTPVLRPEFMALGEALGMSRPKTTATLCYEGDCAKMTGRARPCPVHDDQPPLRTRAAQYPGECTVHQKARDDLATERAAREKAEKEASQYKLWFTETAKSHEATNAHLERAEHERNEHAKHRANLDRKNQELSRENERLVDYASGCQRERDTALALSTERYQELCRQAQRATDAETALASAQHRIAELEAYGNDCCARAVSGAVGNHLHRIAQLESALASARELIERARAWLAWPTPDEPGPEPAACLLNALESWLSSAPSPAPERSDRWNELGELAVTVMATSKYPSPAPCPGCEELKAKLERARTELETAAGYDTTRIRRALEVLR